MASRCFLTVIPLLTLACALGCASPDEQASKLLADANASVEAALSAEATSFDLAYQDYRKAVDNVEAIGKDFPATKAGTYLASSEAKLGPYSPENLKTVVLPQFKAKAEAESDVLSCASELARGETDAYTRGLFYARIAQAHAEHKNDAKLDSAIAAAEDAGRQVPMGMYSPNDVYEAIVGALAKAGRPERAGKLLEKYRLTESGPAVGAVARAWAASGDLAKARTLLKGISDSDERAAVLQAVALGFAKKGQAPSAAAALKEAESASTIDRGNSFASNAAWKVPFVATAAAMHDGPAARRWLKEAHIAVSMTGELEQVLTDLKATGDSASALKIIEEDLAMVDSFDPSGERTFNEVDQVGILSNVALAQIKLNQAEKGLFNLKRAARLVDAPLDLNEAYSGESAGTKQMRRAFAMYRLAVALERAGQVAEAKALIQRLVDLADGVTDTLYPDGESDGKHYILGRAAVLAADLGDWTTATEILKRAGRSDYLIDDLIEVVAKKPVATGASPAPDARPLLHALLISK